ncbi:hydrolase [Aspergillus japonicus CBS 114.51]|uniref:Hydrolase n=1 Tax=Aspergillus japonicus CBS 114.51 TaxID=1448312 RepID=A0A8T8WRF1_ASPJA|nr:hydrolase [Aspergillus japonicus CBS 114.51]RAH78361.1 hydrolase [Aspergillus japonicus CBS 114.51]
MPFLNVSGAILHYTTSGKGPLLLFIHGAGGRGEMFRPVAEQLASSFTVVTWDRRGYSKSTLEGPQDFTNRLEVDASDASRLIEHISSDKSAFVFGTSSGAIVALTLLSRFPYNVLGLVAHEPPCTDVLNAEDRRKAAGFINFTYDLYREKGPTEALQLFLSTFSVESESGHMFKCMDIRLDAETRANTLFWFEFELKQYTSSCLDVSTLKRFATKIIPAAGTLSGDGASVGPITTLSAMLGQEIKHLPGAHIGYICHPNEFATSLSQILQ